MMPIAALARPMISSVEISVALRPMRSPQWPKSAAPTGRAADLAAAHPLGVAARASVGRAAAVRVTASVAVDVGHPTTACGRLVGRAGHAEILPLDRGRPPRS